MKEELLAQLAPFGQEHLLAFWDRLAPDRQAALAAQIRALDLALIARLYGERDRKSDYRALAERSSSPPAFRLPPARNRFTPQEAVARGEAALAAGQVGAILVAGGQGTRLGFPHPKGMFPIGPISGHSLFQIHIEKILALGRRYGVRVPLCLMTSPATHDETVEYLAEHARFGLPADDLRVFCQGTMPAVDAASGRILLESADGLVLSPDGHGGMLAALACGGPLRQIEQRGIQTLFYFQVDNPLVDVGSPEFLGYHLLSNSEMSTQVVAKREPLERVGNVVEVDGRLRVIEYSDLPDDVARQRLPDGSLRIWAGSIAVHAFATAFLARMAGRADALPFHVARKKVEHLDSAGRTVEPAEPNAVKFERFIFDLIPAAENAIVVEIDPAEGFAPLKNAPGEKQDTPEWVRRQMTARHRRWLRRAGVEVADDVPVEISPLFARNPEELARKVRPGTAVTEATFFGV